MLLKMLKCGLRRIIQALPGGMSVLELRHLKGQKRLLAKIGDARSVFEHYFESNAWQDKESVSGPGSTVAYTKNIREQIPLLLAELGVRRILDAPCGDYNWFRLVERGDDVIYLGGDVVSALVETNQTKYGTITTQFMQLDIVNDRLPEADLWLCRDCFIHFSNRDVFAAVGSFLNSSVSYILTTTYPNIDRNIDIPTGLFRGINLQAPPFNFGPPEQVMEDWIDGFEVRNLGLWKRETLSLRLTSNVAYQRVQRGRVRLF